MDTPITDITIMDITTAAVDALYDYDRIPPDTIRSIRDYLREKVLPGSFVEAVLSNDLKEAYARADNQNMFAIPAILYYLYNSAPMTAWGSPEKVERWLSNESQ